MTWIRNIQVHTCVLPLSGTPVQCGSVWQCDDCGMYWRTVAGGAYDPGWRRLSERRGRRIVRREKLKRGVAA